MRHEYQTRGLKTSDVASDPVHQFEQWLADAVAANVDEPNAMVVSTVDGQGAPSSRVLLLKAFRFGGFEFYTNQRSTKAEQLAGNANVALTFPWLQLHRQVNVVGTASKVSDQDADEYFALRPRESQLGAWASEQSQPLADREQLDQQMRDVSQRFTGPVPRPSHWGGYRVTPTMIEFWQGRPNRLHDRLRFTRSPESSSGWNLVRLNP